jgi:hypothetical protein
MPPRVDTVTATLDAARWYRQPLLWLGALIFVGSLVGCVHMIVLAVRHADAPVETAPAVVFGVPASARSSRATPP